MAHVIADDITYRAYVSKPQPPVRKSSSTATRTKPTTEKAEGHILYRRSVIEEYTPPSSAEEKKNVFHYPPLKEDPGVETKCGTNTGGECNSFLAQGAKNYEHSADYNDLPPPPPEFTVDSYEEDESLPPPPEDGSNLSSSNGGSSQQQDDMQKNIVKQSNLEVLELSAPLVSPRPVRRKFPTSNQSRVNELTAEGKNAIDSPGSPTQPDLPPQDYILDEFEERSMIQPASYDDPKLKELISVLIEWINDELAGQRIIVKDIEEDLYDGQILQKLLEKLTDVKLDVVEVTQSEEGQKLKLKRVLDAVNKVLGPSYWNQQRWNVDSIHSKNLVAILHLLVALARHFRAPVRLPENVVINVVVVQKRDGTLHTRTVAEELTSTYDDLGMRVDRDAFDMLFDHAPDKLDVVKRSLITFVNKHLNKIHLEVTDLNTQFHDGLYLTLLMGLLEGYFVPLYSFNLTPTTFDQKVHNVAFAFELMMDAGLQKPKARPEDIVNLDRKSTLRVLYELFSKYKNLS